MEYPPIAEARSLTAEFETITQGIGHTAAELIVVRQRQVLENGVIISSYTAGNATEGFELPEDYLRLDHEGFGDRISFLVPKEYTFVIDSENASRMIINKRGKLVDASHTEVRELWHDVRGYQFKHNLKTIVQPNS